MAQSDLTTTQGVSYQGVSYQGVSYQGASYSSLSLSDATVAGGALIAWKQRPDLTWEQRFPNKVCLWNAARTVRTSCAFPILATTPSPLTGSTWQAVFTQADGTTVQATVAIGASATQIGAVTSDTSIAMFALNGSAAASCPLVQKDQRTAAGERCDAPGGCRTNCDLWTYDVRLLDTLDSSGHPVSLCPGGQPAIALAGTWDTTGQFTPSSTQFTFACPGGTIAKCTRWGYRPWDTATMSNGFSSWPLGPYHQACIRAATADYCADGTSFTLDGTLVDIYDYPLPGQGIGFIERTRGGVVPSSSATAFVWESSFDDSGATLIERTRYMGITSPNTLSLQCASRFALDLETSDGSGEPTRWKRSGVASFPSVAIDSTPVCAHSELMVGTWLHRGCSSCAEAVRSYGIYTDPVTLATVVPYAYCTQAGNRWDSGCVQVAQTQCTASQRMAPHSECVTGAGIGKFATGCSVRVELDSAHAYCATSWDSKCISAANAWCTGGQVGSPGTGFCGSQISAF
ncbi:MAG TPA: ADYC domain-containing protein [Kofleriaceae bacterium]